MQRYTVVGGAHRLIFMGARVAMVVRSANFRRVRERIRLMPADICQVNQAPDSEFRHYHILYCVESKEGCPYVCSRSVRVKVKRKSSSLVEARALPI